VTSNGGSNLLTDGDRVEASARKHAQAIQTFKGCDVVVAM